MAGVKEYLRRCTRCDNEWYIPKALGDEIPPNRWELSGARQMARGRSMTLWASASSKHRYRARADALEAKAARILENSRCPNCGSTSFQQFRTW